jgi:hypothetical protein
VFAAAVLAALAVGLVTSSRATAKTHQTSFVLRFLGATNIVNNPPHSDGGFGPGDILTAHSNIYDATNQHRLGRTSERCIGTVAHPVTFDCSFGLIFRDGSELLVEGHINPTHTPWRAVIVGGTGHWIGTSGYVTETSAGAQSERMTLTIAH